jgi:hypothetical protein
MKGKSLYHRRYDCARHAKPDKAGPSTHLYDFGVNQMAEFIRVIPVCCYSLCMDQKQIRKVVVKALIAIVLAMLFVSLLAQRLFHPQ